MRPKIPHASEISSAEKILAVVSALLTMCSFPFRQIAPGSIFHAQSRSNRQHHCSKKTRPRPRFTFVVTPRQETLSAGCRTIYFSRQEIASAAAIFSTSEAPRISIFGRAALSSSDAGPKQRSPTQTSPATIRALIDASLSLRASVATQGQHPETI